MSAPVSDPSPDGPVTHRTDCQWEMTSPADCGWRPTHHYCPHPEHACDCDGPRRAVDDKLLAEIDRRRNDPDFMARLNRIMTEEKHILDRLAKDD